MWSKIGPQDIIAFLVVIICGTLLIMGRDHLIGICLLAIITGYYGVNLSGAGDWLRNIGKDKKE